MDGDLIRSSICLVNSVKRILDKKNKGYGLSGSQIRCLHVIYRANIQSEEINQKDLESIFNLQKSSISGLLTSMEENGLIKRVTSKKDSRYKAIELTAKGNEIKGECCLLVSGQSFEEQSTEVVDWTEEQICQKVADRIEIYGEKPNTAIKEVAKALGYKKQAIYQIYHEIHS